MKTALILDASGVVTNAIILADDADLAEFDAVKGPEDAGIGWKFDGATWTPPSPASEETPSLPELFEQARQIVEDHVNAMARTRRYTDAVSCASYVASTNPVWASEAKAFVAWRDSVWTQVYALQDKALAGELEKMPTPEELIKSLPVLDWGD